MAANSTLLTMQCASGVAVPPRCLQLHRNLVTKTHKITVMAANPALQYKAGALVSKPPQLDRNSVPKRDKTVPAAYPGTAEIPTSGYPELTDARLQNSSAKALKLDWKNFWVGSGDVDDLPNEIAPKSQANFKHLADTTGSVMGSVGSVAYKINDDLRWIIAWKNSVNESNKVYTEIVSGPVNETKIKNLLDQSGQKSNSEVAEYTSEVEIDRTSAKPELKATLKPKEASK